jgi:hypothetical protein
MLSNTAMPRIVRRDSLFDAGPPIRKGSQQAGLTGFKGGIVRKVAVDKTRSSLEKALAVYKQQLEAKRE